LSALRVSRQHPELYGQLGSAGGFAPAHGSFSAPRASHDNSFMPRVCSLYLG
jgi:hypothetical protein